MPTFAVVRDEKGAFYIKTDDDEASCYVLNHCSIKRAKIRIVCVSAKDPFYRTIGKKRQESFTLAGNIIFHVLESDKAGLLENSNLRQFIDAEPREGLAAKL